MTKTHVKKLRFLRKKKQPGVAVIADSRLQVLFFSDVFETR